jgi:hypothetical protein
MIRKNMMNILWRSALSAMLLTGCEALDTRDDLSETGEMKLSGSGWVEQTGFRAYQYIPNGFTAIDGNLFAAVSDEAQYVTTLSATQRFNEGSWNVYYNPDERYASYFNGIYAVHDFLERTTDYKRLHLVNRDTIAADWRIGYERALLSTERLFAETRVLKAYYYFELMKRYGGVPIIDKTYANEQEANLPRGTVDEVMQVVVSEIDAVKDQLVVKWGEDYDSNIQQDGRITRGAALAIKSRALLYAASPQFNPSGDKTKWADAAAAAFDVIRLGIYSLHNDYGGLFVGETSTTNSETIWATRMNDPTNSLERQNYPIGTQGGGTGICPSQNLVDAYEHAGPVVPDNPWANLDPRFYATIVKNGDTWNGRSMEIYSGGIDDPANQNTSPTGYYLRKFLNEELVLTNNEMALRSWISFRYAEILLNFAEAMNEAYGPDDAHGYGMTAREAVNAVRARVDMPPVVANDVVTMRAAIKHERRIELAFEDHRYWDLRRWDDAKTVLNQPVRGIRIARNGNNFTYTSFEVAKRVFSAPKMNLYPISQAEIVKSNGVLKQNPDW